MSLEKLESWKCDGVVSADYAQQFIGYVNKSSATNVNIHV